jgi:hypothetical protein
MNKFEDHELAAKIKDVLQRAGERGLSKDAITAVIALEHDITTSKALVEMLLKHKIEAQFTGTADDNRLDSDLYSFCKFDA